MGETVQAGRGLLKDGYVVAPLYAMRRLEPGPLALYLWLLHYARQDEHAWPGQAALRERLGVSERTIREWTGELARLGFVETKRRGPGVTMLYRVMLPDEARPAESDTSRPAESDGSRPADSSDLDRQILPTSSTQKSNTQEVLPPPPPQTEITRVDTGASQSGLDTIESSDGKGSALGRPPTASSLQPKTSVERVFAAWAEATGKPTARLDAKRRRLIAQRLTVFDEAELLEAVRGWRHSPWHAGTDPKSIRPYNDLEFLLRDAANVERFRDLERNPPLSMLERRDRAYRQALGLETG